MQKPQFLNKEIYHLYNRGVEKRRVFMENRDYLRFIHDLFAFNDTHAASSANIRFSLRKPSELDASRLSQCLEIGSPNMEREPRKLLVEILCFCLMPNHYHLLVRQLVDGGVVKFMHRLGVGYAMYFNEKYQRVGPLFQGRFKAVLVKNDAHLLYLPHYIHLNAVGLVEPKWKKRIVQNPQRTMQFLGSYRWSSYPDYIGKKNFPSITSRGFLADLVGGPREYKKATKEWLTDGDMETLEEVAVD